jgi:hypothetical protein
MLPHLADIKFFIEHRVVFVNVFASYTEQEVERADKMVGFHDLGNFCYLRFIGV